MRWTRKDQAFVKQVLGFIASNTDRGMSGVARELGTTRQVVDNWRTRGQIPLEKHDQVIDLARRAADRADKAVKSLGTVRSADLHPVSRNIIKSHEAAK